MPEITSDLRRLRAQSILVSPKRVLAAVSLNNNKQAVHGINDHRRSSLVPTCHFSRDDIKQATKLWCQCPKKNMNIGMGMSLI
jgi:hypothetical protein